MRDERGRPLEATLHEPAPGAERRVGRTSLRLSQLGLGSAAIGNLYTPVDDATAAATVETAVRLGVGYVDTAPYYGYGLAERRVGAALRAIGSAGVVVSTSSGLAPTLPIWGYVRQTSCCAYEGSVKIS